MKIRLLFVPLLLALVASLAACGGGGAQKVPANAIAVVNGTPITLAEFNTYFAYAKAVAAAQGHGLQPGTPQYVTTRNQVTAFLVQFDEVKQQAPNEGVSVSDSDVHKFLADLAKTQYGGSMTKLVNSYKKQGMSEPLLKQLVYFNLLSTKIKTKVTKSAKVNTAEERVYYNANIAQYNTPATTTRSVEHILVKEHSLANTLEQKLKNGASFASLAKQYSKDPGSAAQGGKYTATKGKEVPAYDASAFSLQTGVLSAPVDATSSANGGYGWFIIKALGPVKTVPAHTTPFTQAQATIESSLLQQRQQVLWQQWISDLAKHYQGKVSYLTGYAPPTTTALPTTT